MDNATILRQLWQLAVDHKWVPFAAVLVGLIVRALKSDTKIPIDIPPRLRTPLAYFLGLALGVLESVAGGERWEVAIVGGLAAAAFAQQGHLWIIDVLRGGKEFPLPWLIKPGAAPSPNSPVTIPPAKPPTPPPLPVLLFFALAIYVMTGCTTMLRAADILADKIKCAVAHQDLPNEAIIAKCAVAPEDVSRVIAIVGESRAAAKRAGAAGACGPSSSGQPDAGAPEAGK